MSEDTYIFCDSMMGDASLAARYNSRVFHDEVMSITREANIIRLLPIPPLPPVKENRALPDELDVDPELLLRPIIIRDPQQELAQAVARRDEVDRWPVDRLACDVLRHVFHCAKERNKRVAGHSMAVLVDILGSHIPGDGMRQLLASPFARRPWT